MLFYGRFYVYDAIIYKRLMFSRKTLYNNIENQRAINFKYIGEYLNSMYTSLNSHHLLVNSGNLSLILTP